MKEYLGKHWLIEFYNCDESLLKLPEELEAIMLEAAKAMNATVVNSTFHHFTPLGVSGVVVIKESHLTIHTWPEYKYAAVDIFTCGPINMSNGVTLLKSKLKATVEVTEKIKRGNQNLISKYQQGLA